MGGRTEEKYCSMDLLFNVAARDNEELGDLRQDPCFQTPRFTIAATHNNYYRFLFNVRCGTYSGSMQTNSADLGTKNLQGRRER